MAPAPDTTYDLFLIAVRIENLFANHAYPVVITLTIYVSYF